MRLVTLLLAVALLVPAGLALAGSDPARPADPGDLCEPRRAGEQCGPGNGRQTPGGGAKVSHEGWPRITGILWKVLDSADHRKVGGPDNDELLGHHGSDRITGAGGHDILWGDWNPKNNSVRQRDVLRGGSGNDWIYPSHGRTTVDGGPGRDYVWAYYGRGVIDCGAGDEDTARVRLETRFRVRNCERIRHFCAFGSDGKGGCKKPGEARVARRGRR
jgi:hemolysin type calcium-binding protein